MPAEQGPAKGPVSPDSFWPARVVGRREALLGAGGLAASFALASCTGSGPSNSSSAPVSGPAGPSTAPASSGPTGTPKRGGKLTVAVEGNGLKDIMDAQNDLAKIDQARAVTGWEPLLE